MKPAPKIPLRTWAARKWDPPPPEGTLRHWVRYAKIHPAPERVGRRYYVAPDAQYIDGKGNPTT